MSVNSRKLGYTTSEAARRLGVSLSTIRRWSDMGYLRGYRTPGGQRRFSGEQLDEFVESLEADGPRASSGDDTPEPGVHRHHEEPERPLHEQDVPQRNTGAPSFWPPANAA